MPKFENEYMTENVDLLKAPKGIGELLWHNDPLGFELVSTGQILMELVLDRKHHLVANSAV